jgi:hypothetical protein
MKIEFSQALFAFSLFGFGFGFGFINTVSLCGPGCPQTSNLPASDS